MTASPYIDEGYEAPTTKEGWRRYVERKPPIKPELPTQQAWDRLSSETRDEFNDALARRRVAEEPLVGGAVVVVQPRRLCDVNLQRSVLPAQSHLGDHVRLVAGFGSDTLPEQALTRFAHQRINDTLKTHQCFVEREQHLLFRETLGQRLMEPDSA